MSEENIFVLKDNEGNFVSSHSIFESTKGRVGYSYSKFLTNGFYYQPTQKRAEADLDKLNQMQARFQLSGKQFHVEQINRREVLFIEHQLGVSKDPFIHEYFDFKDGKQYGWVIKDSQGNYAHAKSIKKIDNILHYISFKTFGPESRGYADLLKAEMALDVLKWEAEKMRLDETFHLEYINHRDVAKEYKAFKGETMVIVTKKKQVA